jgi:HTH-type transcriptional regulator / antitoxin HipB
VAIGEQIAAARARAGLTQAQLAEVTGLRQPGIADYERGEREPGRDVLERIAAATGHRLEYRPAVVRLVAMPKRRRA